MPVIDGRKGSPRLHPLRADPQQPARLQHRPGRQARRDQRQAVADRLGDRRDQGRCPVRATMPIRAPASSPSRSSVSGRFTPPSTARATPTPRCSSTARWCKWNIDKAIRPMPARRSIRSLHKVDVHYQPGHNSHLHGRDQGGGRQVADVDEQVLQGPVPQRRPAQAGERAADRHLGRRDEAGPRWPDLRRAARLHHRPPRHRQPGHDLGAQ